MSVNTENFRVTTWLLKALETQLLLGNFQAAKNVHIRISEPYDIRPLVSVLFAEILPLWTMAMHVVGLAWLDMPAQSIHLTSEACDVGIHWQPQHYWHVYARLLRAKHVWIYRCVANTFSPPLHIPTQALTHTHTHTHTQTHTHTHTRTRTHAHTCTLIHSFCLSVCLFLSPSPSPSDTQTKSKRGTTLN